MRRSRNGKAKTEGTTLSAPAPRRRPEESALFNLLQMPHARYEELLAVPAQYALDRLGAATVSLSRWERDRGLLRCVVNVGDLAAAEERFPTAEIFDLANYEELLDLPDARGVGYSRDDANLSPVGAALLARHGRSAAVSAPVQLDGRIWGVLWATSDSGPLSPAAMQVARATAEAIAPMIELAERLQAMARLAFEDPLTGLGNRRRLDDALAELLAKDGPGCTVVVCDVNGLKQINDTLGHQAGDQAIMAVADALAAAASSLAGAVAVRLGGDEFALLIPGAAREVAIRAVEATAERLHERQIGISCGIATVAAGTSAREALGAADGAQYGAKRRGALLLVASDLSPADAATPRRRISDLRPAAASPPLHADVRAGVALAVRTIAEDLARAPADTAGRLEWLGEHLLVPFDLDQWALSTVDLAGPQGRLLLQSVGMRVERSSVAHPAGFDLDHYPLTERALHEGGWFCVDVRDRGADPGERALLDELGARFVLAVGRTEGSRGFLLELYGGHDDPNVVLLGHTLALAASAVLGASIVQVSGEPARMSP